MWSMVLDGDGESERATLILPATEAHVIRLPPVDRFRIANQSHLLIYTYDMSAHPHPITSTSTTIPYIPPRQLTRHITTHGHTTPRTPLTRHNNIHGHTESRPQLLRSPQEYRHDGSPPTIQVPCPIDGPRHHDSSNPIHTLQHLARQLAHLRRLISHKHTSPILAHKPEYYALQLFESAAAATESADVCSCRVETESASAEEDEGQLQGAYAAG